MNRSCTSLVQFSRRLLLTILSLLLILACTPTVERPKGLAGQFEDAKDMFKQGRFDRSLEFTDSLATASPPNKFTERARVLRAVIFSGEVKACRDLAEAYTRGVDSARDPHYKAAFGQQRHDNLQLGANRALDLGEVVQQLTQGGIFPKELTLEASYPATEGPLEVSELNRVREGGWIPPEQQDAVSVDAVRKGIDDALAEVVGGDRSKARAVLAAGPAKLDGVNFALYLGKGLLDGAAFFDRKHIRDTQKYKTLLNLADGAAKAALGLLKENPNKDKEAEVKKLQDQIKTALKNA